MVQHVLVRGDELVDCTGPMLHVSANRPDKSIGDQGNRNKFRLPTSPQDYTNIAAAPSTRRFKYGFIMTYVRDSNYQMFVVNLVISPAHMLCAWSKLAARSKVAAVDLIVTALQVVDLSRYWFLLKLVEASWTIPAGETLAIVVSGSEGGSAELKHPGVSHTHFIAFATYVRSVEQVLVQNGLTVGLGVT